MQSLQLHLTGAAWSWLSKLPNDSIGSWSELAEQFTCNFRSTYTRPASIEEVKSYTQKSGESLRSYIQRWNVIKNSAENVFDERAIDAFVFGLRRSDLVEEMGRTKPKMVSELIEIATDSQTGRTLIRLKRIYNFLCSMLVYTPFALCFVTFHGVFYALGTNLLTRRHSASSLFSAVFVFQKSYTGNILGIGRNKSRTSYFSRTRVGVQSRDGGGQDLATP
jgi:hypothetical protein